MHAQPDLERLAGGGVDGLPSEPLHGEIGEGDLAGVGIEVGPAQQVSLDGGAEPLGVALAIEVLGALRPGRLAVADPPGPVGPALDARHLASCCSCLSRSGGTPPG